MPSGHLPSRAERLIAAAGHDGNTRDLNAWPRRFDRERQLPAERRVAARMILT
jgi:hypothetical protein